MIDSVLQAYKDELIQTFGTRGQLEFYGTKKWNAESSVGTGKAALKAMHLLAYILSPIHRNSAKQGSAGINDELIRRETA